MLTIFAQLLTEISHYKFQFYLHKNNKMQIKIGDGNTNKLHQSLNLILNSQFTKNGYEYDTIISKKDISLSIHSLHFGNGFDFNAFKGNINHPLELEFSENNNNYIRFLIVRKGELIHTLSPSIRYRLNNGFSAIVAVKGANHQKLTFPTQNNLEFYLLQVETKRYSIDLKSDFFEMPKEFTKVLMNREMDDHFIFQSNYVYTISETIDEINTNTKVGISKRFYLESKALEILWLHTEQYNNERKFGFDNSVLKKIDVKLLKKAKEFIHQNQEKELTLSLLAKEIGTNETKIKLGFRKLYGKTFSEILRLERFNKAKLLLEEGELSIKEIALACGYKSISMLSVRFKEHFGMSPSKYKSSQNDVFVSLSEVVE